MKDSAESPANNREVDNDAIQTLDDRDRSNQLQLPMTLDNSNEGMKAQAIVSVAKYHTSAWNQTYKYNFCDKCDEVRLPRTYHCDYCNRCVLRLDHHCPWMGTCIGLFNYKFYWQFLLYSCISFLILSLTVLLINGLSILAVLGIIYLVDFAILLAVQTNLVLQNKMATDKAYLVGDFDIYKDKTWAENWQ